MVIAGIHVGPMSFLSAGGADSNASFTCTVHAMQDHCLLYGLAGGTHGSQA